MKEFTRSERTLILLLAFVKFAHMMDFIIMMPLGPRLMDNLQIGPTEFSYVVASYSFFAGISGLVAAMFLDWFDRRKALLFLFGGFFVTTLACAFSPTYVTLLINRSLTGVFGGVLGAMCFSIIGDVIPAYKRGHANGILMTGFSMASVLGVPVGLYFANLNGWRFPFLLLGVLCGVVWIFMFKILKPMRAHINANRDPFLFFKAITSNMSLGIGLVFFSALIFSQFSVISFISPTLVANAGVLESQLPYVYFLGGFATLFTSPFMGVLSDRHGRLKVFAVCLFLSLIPIALITNLFNAPLVLTFAATTLLFVLIGGRVIPAVTIMTEVAPSHLRGSLMSVNSTFANLSAAAAAFVAGQVVTEGADGVLMNYEKVGYLSIGMSVFAFWLSTKIGYKQPNLKQKAKPGSIKETVRAAATTSPATTTVIAGTATQQNQES